jgi:hypothetical protein
VLAGLRPGDRPGGERQSRGREAPSLKDLYLNLLAAKTGGRRADYAHPRVC